MARYNLRFTRGIDHLNSNLNAPPGNSAAPGKEKARNADFVHEHSVMATSATGTSDPNAAAFVPLLKKGQASASPRPMLLQSFNKLAAISDNKFKEENDSRNAVSEGLPEKVDTTGEEVGAVTTCAKVLAMTEMAEHVFNFLPEQDILRCMRVSRSFEDTIRGSIKLQRRVFLATDNTVLTGIAVKRQRFEGESSEAENGGRQGICANERLLRTNPFIIRPLPAEPCGEDQ
ncbi:hypothetical protein TI39_contig4111g00011 [Zymoseptoria brevis]|uniref:F-box domain-containing protein n=1 Tax=Zymoseptoria brevis TaxID=1047168 RepID=A0A0F4GET8_9PEZI|nr:hypothetical protein TI39_contig4111g00011 [Zymoseptoria brevis]